MKPIISLEGISKRFSGVWALRNVDVAVDGESIVGVIGPNGSGKTTLLNVCNGVYPPTSGRVLIDGEETTGSPPYQVAMAGVMRTFQEARVFKTMTCLQNMRVPLLHSDLSDVAVRSKAESLLDLVGLSHHTRTPASELSGGQQKLLEFARALMTSPRLVLMDEPFAGVHPTLKQRMVDSIRTARHDGVSALIVSHELPVLLGLADRVVCMAEGRILMEGDSTTVSSDERVIAAYLGSASAIAGPPDEGGQGGD